jgi:hypothetical protein
MWQRQQQWRRQRSWQRPSWQHGGNGGGGFSGQQMVMLAATLEAAFTWQDEATTKYNFGENVEMMKKNCDVEPKNLSVMFTLISSVPVNRAEGSMLIALKACISQELKTKVCSRL